MDDLTFALLIGALLAAAVGGVILHRRRAARTTRESARAAQPASRRREARPARDTVPDDPRRAQQRLAERRAGRQAAQVVPAVPAPAAGARPGPAADVLADRLAELAREHTLDDLPVDDADHGFEATRPFDDAAGSPTSATSRDPDARAADDLAARTSRELEKRLADARAARREAQARAEADTARRAAADAQAAEAARLAAAAQAEREARAAAARLAEENEKTARLAALAAAREAAARAGAQAERAREQREAEQRVARQRAAEQAAAEQVARARAAEDARLAVTTDVPVKTPAETLILVVDDSKIVRIKTGRLLEKHGYRVAYGVDGQDGAQRAAQEAPDLVVTDVEMPTMNGFELARHLRAQPATAQVPIIMITSAEEQHRGTAAQAGIEAVLGKPYDEDTLVAHIRAHRFPATATAVA